MHIIEVGKWLKLSKICYNDEWYQIYANSLGIRIFIKCGEIETYPLLKSFLYLDMVFNYRNNGIYYDEDRTKQLLLNYFKFTLNLNIFYKAYEVIDRCLLIRNNVNIIAQKMESASKSKTLITTEEIKEYLPEVFEIEEIVDNNSSIPAEYKMLIKKYILEHKKEDLQILAYNLKQVKILPTNKRSSFDKFNYIIKINEDNKEENLYHELRHASKLVAYEDLYTVLHNDFLINNYKSSIGLAILEGINSKYTSNTYLNEQNIINMIILIIGEEELLKCENEDISKLIDILSKYSTREKIIKLIMMLDDELTCKTNHLKYDVNSKMTIYKILMECYLYKIDYMLENINIKNIVYKIKKYNIEVEKFSEILKTDDIIIKQHFQKEYSKCYHEFIKKHIENLNLTFNSKINKHEQIEDFTFIERQIYDQNFIINDENFITKRIKYDNSNAIYIYDIYIKTDYLKTATKEELLEYISLEGLNNALENLEVNDG